MRIAFLLALLWIAPSVFAESAAELVLAAPRDSALARRVAAELRALGFVVRHSDAALAPPLTPAQDASAVVLQLDPAPGALHVYLYGAAQGEQREQLDVDAQASEAQLAIRIVEFVRAALLEPPRLEPAQRDDPVAPEARSARVIASTPGRPASPPTAAAPVATHRAHAPLEQRARASVELGFGTLVSPGHLGVSYGLTLSAGGFVRPALRLAVSAFAPLNALTEHVSAGSSRSRLALVAADLRAELPQDAQLQASIGCGVGVAILATEGRTAMPLYSAESNRRVSPGMHVRGGLGYHFAKSLALRLDVTVGMQLSRFVVAYGSQQGGHWGMPWFLGALALEFKIR